MIRFLQIIRMLQNVTKLLFIIISESTCRKTSENMSVIITFA